MRAELTGRVKFLEGADWSSDYFCICQNRRCGEPFVSQRKGREAFLGRVKFCSTKCSAYVRVTKARAIKKLAMSDDHETNV